jgi:hypothetical protein
VEAGCTQRLSTGAGENRKKGKKGTREEGTKRRSEGAEGEGEGEGEGERPGDLLRLSSKYNIRCQSSKAGNPRARSLPRAVNVNELSLR